MVFGITIPPIIDINVKTPRTPIPSRIYEQLQNLDRYDDVLVEYEILNLTENPRRIILETNIGDLTDISRQTFLLPWMNDPTWKKPVIVKHQTPLLKHGILTNLVNPIRSTLSCKVLDSDTQEILYHETFKIDILPHDQMLFGISSVSSSTNYSLSQFLGAWITSNDKEGLLDEVRAWAARLHPDKSIYVENPNSLAEIDLIVQSVFNYLKWEWMIYVNQPFNSVLLADSQRVLLPETVLKHKAGNCIDLTITFASILEWFWIDSLIFLTPNHAFIWWWNKNITKEMLFLETTMIWEDTYENAKIVWEQQFRENFLFHNCENILAPWIKESSWYEILELAKIRKDWISRTL